MHLNGSPPKLENKNENINKLKMGGSNKLIKNNNTNLSNKSIKKSRPSMNLLNKLDNVKVSSYSEQSSSSDDNPIIDSNQLIGRDYTSSNYHYPYSYSRSNMPNNLNLYNLNNSSNKNDDNHRSNGNGRKTKRNTWGSRERAGMSFVIVIAFFGIFALIIITELFMIDDKNHGGIVVLRHGNLASRLGDSMPDYDNMKDDYDVLDPNLFMTGDNQNNGNNGLEANKIKISEQSGIPVSDYIIHGASGKLPFGQRLDERIEVTLPHYSTTMKPKDGIWQIVNGTRFKFFVFSAYYDRRGGRLLRIIGATKTRSPEKVWCRLWYPYKDNKNQNQTKYYSATVIGRVKVIRENWNLKYSACFVLCSLKSESLEIPHSVSVVSRLRAPPGNLLKLRNTDWDYDYSHPNQTFSKRIIPDEISVCVKPIHFNYNQALYLMEYLELNSLLGVTHFTFYNHTIGPQAECVLNHYINKSLPDNLNEYSDDYINLDTERNSSLNQTLNIKNKFIRKQTKKSNRPTVEIFPWDLNMRSQKEIRTEGLFAALNDCLYRNMYRYKYVALIDIDEFLIPRQNNTLKDLLRILNKRISSRRNTGSYSFQNAFFYLQFDDDEEIFTTTSKNQQLRAALLTQRKTWRKSKLHPQKQRSKYIARPEKVIEAGNHFIWEFVPGASTLNVPADSGILHHYRVCEFGGDDCIKSPSVVDRTATRYMSSILERVELIYSYLKTKCHLSDLPPMPVKKPPKIRNKLIINNKIQKAKKKTDTKVLNKTEYII